MYEDVWPNRIDRMRIGMEWEQKFEARKWCGKIPSIPFKEGWLVQIIPPFAGAVVRFLVTTPYTKDSVSVYLDCYGMLGACDHPYWEVYPYDENTFRCDMNDIDALVEAIDYALKNIRAYYDSHHKS